MMDIEFINKLLKIAYINLIRNLKGILKKHCIEVLIIGVFMILPYIISQKLRVEMFEYAGDKSNSIVVILIWLLCFIISFIFTIFSFKIFHKWDRVSYRSYCFIFVIVLFLFFLGVARHCAYSICLFNPLIFVPVLIMFMLAIRGARYFYLYLILFLSLFIGFIAIDKFYEFKFTHQCQVKTPTPKYNPIYLSDDFFHKEFVDDKNKLVPNISKIDVFDKYEDKHNYIYIYNCSSLNRKHWWNKLQEVNERLEKIKSLIKKGNVALCKCSSLVTSYSDSVDINIYLTKIIDFDEFGNDVYREIYKASYLSYVGEPFIKKIIPYRKQQKCIYSSNKSLIANDVTNYIKTLSEKTLGE